VNHETLQACLAVCKMFVARLLEEDPSSEQVNLFIQKVVDEPGFAHRAYRHLAEIQRSASRHRRLFLASVLFGLPFTSLADDERDRVDMVVDRMIPADVELLMRIAETIDRPPPPGAKGFEGRIMGQGNVVAFVNETELRLVTADYWKDSDSNFVPEAEIDPKLVADRSALTALISLDCVVLGEILDGGDVQQHDYVVKSIRPTSLGYMVIRAINEVRPGLSAELSDDV